MFSSFWCCVFLFLVLFFDRLGGQLYGYISSSFTTSSIMAFFGNLYIVPAYGYSAFLMLATFLSLTNFALLYFLNLNPEWPSSVYVTIRTNDEKTSQQIRKFTMSPTRLKHMKESI